MLLPLRLQRFAPTAWSTLSKWWPLLPAAIPQQHRKEMNSLIIPRCKKALAGAQCASCLTKWWCYWKSRVGASRLILSFGSVLGSVEVGRSEKLLNHLWVRGHRGGVEWSRLWLYICIWQFIPYLNQTDTQHVFLKKTLLNQGLNHLLWQGNKTILFLSVLTEQIYFRYIF
jgi:hypothetical protein